MHHRPFITFFCLLPQLGVAAPLEYPKLEWRRGGEGVPRGGTQLYARVLLHRRQALDRPDERIILSNCVDSNGVKSSKMAYYNGEAGPAPESVAIVDNPGGGTQIWEETTTTAKFGDDVSFSARISGVVGEGEFAGTGKNNFVDFACWKRFKRNLFNWDDDTCTGIYECTHEPRPKPTPTPVKPPPEDTTSTSATTSSSPVNTPSPQSTTPTTTGELLENTTDTTTTSANSKPSPTNVDEDEGDEEKPVNSKNFPRETPDNDPSDSNSNEETGLQKKSNQIALGVGLGLGLPVLIVAIWTLICMKKRKKAASRDGNDNQQHHRGTGNNVQTAGGTYNQNDNRVNTQGGAYTGTDNRVNHNGHGGNGNVIHGTVYNFFNRLSGSHTMHGGHHRPVQSPDSDTNVPLEVVNEHGEGPARPRGYIGGGVGRGPHEIEG